MAILDVDIFGAAVTDGIKGFIYFLMDAIFSMGADPTAGTGTTAINSTNTPSTIVSMISYNVDPYSFDFVREWQMLFLALYVFTYIVMLLLGGAWVLLHYAWPSFVQNMNWLQHGTYTDNFVFGDFLKDTTIGIFLPMFLYFELQFFLKITTALTSIISAQALDAVPLAADNIAIYITMGLCYLVLSFLFGFRTLAIILFAAGGLGLGALYLVKPIRPLVLSTVIYLHTLIFMQPIVVFIAAVGVTALNNVPLVIRSIFPCMYLALIVAIAGVAFVMTFGFKWIMRSLFYAKVML